MDENERNLNIAWTDVEGEGLVRVIPTDSFRTGLALVGRLAEIAEEQGHDPDVLLTNSKVVITLYTHSENSVTQKDRQFAMAVDELLG